MWSDSLFYHKGVFSMLGHTNTNSNSRSFDCSLKSNIKANYVIQDHACVNASSHPSVIFHLGETTNLVLEPKREP